MIAHILNFILCFLLMPGINRCDNNVKYTYFGIGDLCLRDLYPYTTLEGIDKIIKVCLKIHQYYDCLMKKRRGEDLHIQEHVTPFFQKMYPDEYDLRRGGYVFCLEMLPQIIRSYALDDRKVKNCEVSLQRHLCYDVKMKIDFDLDSKNTFSEEDTRIIKEMSCNYSIKYFTCLREQFEKCTTNEFPMFYMQLAELGPVCLIQHKTFVPMILWKACWYIFQAKGLGHSAAPLMFDTLAAVALGLLLRQKATSLF